MELTPEERLKRKRAHTRAWHQTHREARSRIQEKYYRNNRETIRARQVARRIARQEAEARRPKPECCDVCGAIDDIHFDHCHQRGIFRGWLCHACNTVLGLLNDDPNRLRMLTAYLERTKDLVSPQLTLPGI